MKNINEFLAKHSYFKPDDFSPGGLRIPGDFRHVGLMQRSNGNSLFCHQQSLFDEVVMEIHREHDNDHNIMAKPVTESFGLDPEQRLELAMYLLSTITVIGK